ncbi:MAG: hyaluronidase [Proteobacteria bacterium]|nr:MAG: hyaluronidase [Pseudomonadota bacterium]
MGLMPKLGIMEIFFGSPWPKDARLSYAKFLKEAGYEIYLYGPKADPFLRRRWREEWPAEYRAELSAMSATFRSHGIQFGVCFSPMGYHEEDPARAAALLAEKIKILNEIGIDELGLFFDDMPVHDALAATQLEIVKKVRMEYGGKILFCPSFYSPDPILDKVFGARPPNYLEDLAEGLPSDIEIAWTGPKVISPEIGAAHLSEVAAQLRRPPSLCDNFFANDGPKNCKFLKLKLLSGRGADSFAASSAWYFNPMNQAELSKPLLLAAAKTLREGAGPEAAYEEALRDLCSPVLAKILIEERGVFLDQGLDKISAEDQARLRAQLRPLLAEPMAAELLSFLDGAYTVGSECLTD